MCVLMRLVVLLGTHSIIILILSSSAPVTWRSSRTLRDEGEEVQPAALGQTQGQLCLQQHCIKPIIHYQGLFSATVNVLFTSLKNVSNGVPSTAGSRDCKHVFLSFPYKRINKKTAVRRFNSAKPLSGALCCTKKPIAKKPSISRVCLHLLTKVTLNNQIIFKFK